MKTWSCVFLLTALSISAAAIAGDYKVPRMPYGHPDLQGVWNTRFILPMESRPDASTLTLPEAEAQAFAEKYADEIAGFAVLKFDPEIGDMHKSSAEHGLAVVRGERRTRQIVLPADGKLPYTAAARRETNNIDSFLRTEVNPPVVADHPEQRPNWERCVALQGQPPITTVNDVNPRRFVQTQDHIVIHTEYGDEARIIPFTDKHGPEVLAPLLGDSIARWDGDTLVIETVRLPDKDRIRYFPTLLVPSTSTVIEKYTRLSQDELLYQYTIIDPSTYTKPWLAEYSLYLTNQRTFEFACHEGNYSLPGIMAGAREQERREAAK